MPLFLVAVSLVWMFGAVPRARAQADTTTTAPPDTVRRVPGAADTTDTPTPTLDPTPYPGPLYGTPRTDSLPARLPHGSVEEILAETPSSFLYNLGNTGWPHGWSSRGLAPHRVHLWLDGHSFDDPLTGRPRFELLPPSFLAPPRTGLNPGGGGIGVHTRWRPYTPKRPVTELRYRWGGAGLHAIEAAHSQKRRLNLFDRGGILQVTFGYGGRKSDGLYSGSSLRRERRIWGRLRYQTPEWVVELTDQSSRHRVGAHGGVQPPGQFFESIYGLPIAATSVENPRARRLTYRNDLTARVEGPLFPFVRRPTELSATWTSNTFEFRPDYTGVTDTTWTVKMHGGQINMQQSLGIGPHEFTLRGHGELWTVSRSTVSEIDGTRGSAHLLVRDSLSLGQTDLVLDAGGHVTPGRQYPSLSLRAQRTVGPFLLSAHARRTGQRTSWLAADGFTDLVQPLSQNDARRSGVLTEGRITATTQAGPLDGQLSGFAHQIRNPVDLYADVPEQGLTGATIPDTVAARQPAVPVRRAGATLSVGLRRDADRGLYATAQGTLLETLNAGASPLHTRLARTLPSAYGRARIGARFVFFTDLKTELYVQARGWSQMNSRWFHPPTGRLVVPPADTPIPAAPSLRVGPGGTIDVRAEVRLRSATLFLTAENIQAGTPLQRGTFIVPVYPLSPQKFRFGVFWPIPD